MNDCATDYFKCLAQQKTHLLKTHAPAKHKALTLHLQTLDADTTKELRRYIINSTTGNKFAKLVGLRLWGNLNPIRRGKTSRSKELDPSSLGLTSYGKRNIKTETQDLMTAISKKGSRQLLINAGEQQKKATRAEKNAILKMKKSRKKSDRQNYLAKAEAHRARANLLRLQQQKIIAIAETFQLL